MALGNVLLLALIFVTVGFVGGALVAMLFAGRSGKETDEEQPTEETPMQAEPTDEAVATVVEQPFVQTEDEIEVLRLLRSRSSGKLIAVLDEKRFRSTEDMDERLRQQTALLTREWLIWLGMPGDERQKSTRNKPTAVEASPSQLPSAKIETPHPSPPPVAVAPPPTEEAATKDQKAKKTEKALLSIVEQIDEVLQEMLPNSPLAGQIIKLVEDAKEGVIVWIGARRYHGIDAVDDPEAKALLRAAIAEWEHRTEKR